ncbi:hypothetical protein SASPL_137926 [Salvia splendens]|uniref:Reverse transcriptase Ty1/copia-type domain-containing protein n=1 Tax=Salvia splendens TaxID=180675 RepID=A0A8X8ZDM8_SALSN|nr:hypothetical protein SASPL_137926 [Salvia splendens]
MHSPSVVVPLRRTHRDQRRHNAISPPGGTLSRKHQRTPPRPPTASAGRSEEWGFRRSALPVSDNLAYMDSSEFDTVKSEVKPSLTALQWRWRPRMRGDWEWAHALVLSGFGLPQSASDHSFFYKHSAAGHFFGVVIYVDDILVASSEDNLISEFKDFLASHFKFKDLGNPKYFLGIEIARNSTGTGIFISQHKYALDLVTDAGLLGCKLASTHMDSIKQLQMDVGAQLDDLTLSQFLSKPCSDHLLVAERVLKYLKGTIGHGLFYSARADPSLSIFSDADWVGCPDTERSISGSCLFLGTSLISWRSKKQHTISRSRRLAPVRPFVAISASRPFQAAASHRSERSAPPVTVQLASSQAAPFSSPTARIEASNS